MHLSEDDIRTKVVYEWLKDCGVSDQQITIEQTINLKLGKGIKPIHSRADLLVRSKEGRNLLIVEVKNPNHTFLKDDEKQAMSYARAVNGNIAPFTILTNGDSSVIFDTVSGEKFDSSSIPASHPHVKAGFIPSSDGIKERMEALKFLISASADNLLAFCKGQIDFRMKVLKGEDIRSGKKYIPELYVERSRTLEELEGKLFNNEGKKRNLILVVGPPQHGKTCFMCHTAEHFLSAGHPSLFYPAIGLTSGLIPSIQEDFEWCFGEHMDPIQWIRRLNSIGERLGKRIFIFIDGWNEMAERALNINYECQRLDLNYLSIVLSTTSPSLKRLLADPAGNPTFVSENINLNYSQIEKLLTEPLRVTEKFGIVQIGEFDSDESIKAIAIYGKTYKVSFPKPDLLLSHPFYLRLASEQFERSEVPASITRTELIRKSLALKGKRRNINEAFLYDSLIDLAKVFYEYGRPTSMINFPKLFRDEEKLIPWRESAIISLLTVDGIPHLDFYYSHDLDFSVAVLYKNWRKYFTISNEMETTNELNESAKSEVGQSALRWFFSAPENCDLIQGLFNTLKFDDHLDLKIIKQLSECIVKQVVINQKIEFQWLEPHLSKLVDFELVKDNHGIQLSELIFSLVMSLDREKNRDSYLFWMRLLVKYDETVEELGIQESYIHRYYGGEEKEIRSWNEYDEDASLDVNLFWDLMFDADLKVAKQAALFYAYTCPMAFLENYPLIRKKLFQLGFDHHDILYNACERIAYVLGDQYYGYSMCKGWLSNLVNETNNEEAAIEYHKMTAQLSPIIIDYAKEEFSISMNNMLKDLMTIGGIIEQNNNEEIQFNDPNQLKFNF